MIHNKKKEKKWETTYIIYENIEEKLHTIMLDEKYIESSKYFEKLF